MKNRVVWAIAALVVLAGGIAAFVVVNGDDGGGSASATTTTSTTTLDDTTTAPTTVAPAATSSTTAATTSTTARATTTTTARATTTTVVAAACGTGRATVSFTAKDLVTDALSSTFVPEAIVANQVSAPIEVEEVTIEVTYPGNETRTVRFSTGGTVVAPGTSASFTSDKLTSAQRYQSVRFTRFTYFTQGQKEACRVTTP